MTVRDITPDVGALYRHRETGRVMRLRLVWQGVAYLSARAESWHGDLDHFWAEFVHTEAGD